MNLQGLKTRLRPQNVPPQDEDFDPAFYRTHYSDLSALKDPAQLWRHYWSFGRAEGRMANEAEAIAKLEAELGPLPADFDPSVYRAIHPDLVTALETNLEAAEHYLRQGRKEGRKHLRFDPDLYRELYFPDKVVTDYELELDYKESSAAEGRFGSWTEYIRAEGIAGGAWVDRLKKDEFELLNWSWTGPIRNKLAAVRLFLAEGVERLAPIAFDAVFDPEFYRETHPDFGDLSDADLYRRWLFRDLERNVAGSAEEQLKRWGLRISEYPSGFAWSRYAKRHGLAQDRWTALRHLVDGGEAEISAAPISAEGASLLVALGEHHRGRDDPAAIAAFKRARSLGDRSYSAAHHAADACFRLGRWREALALFQEAAQFPDAEVWTFVNGAKSAIRLEAFEAAEVLLAQGLGKVSGEPPWRRAVEELAESFFEARTREARLFYGFPDGRARADAAVEAVVAEVAGLWERLDPVGAPLPASPKSRVVVLANHDLKVCVHYRIEQKRELFELTGRTVEFYDLDEWRDFISALPGAAAAIVFRLPAWPSVVRALQAARKLGVPTYYELDDLIFDAAEFPDTLDSYGGLLSPEEYEDLLFGVPLFRAAIGMCDYGISSTEPLARAMRPLVRTGEVFWLPNGLDSRNEGWLTAPPPRMRRDGSVVIAYASGTKAHNTDWNELAGPALVRLLKTRPEVKLLLVGYLALDKAFDEVRDQVIRFDYVPGSEAWWSMLADADISFAVLKPTWATDSKSEIKWLEAAVLGIPSVVSETALYAQVLEDGVDAILARTPEEWFDAFERLVDDPELRGRIGAKARAKAAEGYTLQANAARLEALLQPALALRKPFARTGSCNPRILLANVWFPPQTIGGATRVVRNNLDAWLDGPERDEFDFAVVATDLNIASPDRLRVDDYRGVPVLRISTPIERNMDWRPENDTVFERFVDILRSWRPDLVHFHAVQRLTASAVLACQETGVPYVVTVHDAWWLSDHHFLVDDQGRVRQPCEDVVRDPPPGVTIAESMDRRRVLRTALQGAEAVLGVSQTFADLHRECGYEKAVAIPNGVPPAPIAQRTPSPSGRVRLAHIGNVSKHKGYHLVQAALKQGAFSNLELTVVDHGRAGGSEERTTWGRTPVRVIGKVAQEHVHELYAQTDVLLAPSIWPESFGLVTREALAAGCWVVASDRGAMGEDVTPGANGFVIDVSTVEGLLGALRTIDADPARYLVPPATRPRLRTARDQARDVAALYRRLLAAGGQADGSVRPTAPKRPGSRSPRRARP